MRLSGVKLPSDIKVLIPTPERVFLPETFLFSKHEPAADVETHDHRALVRRSGTRCCPSDFI